MTFIAPIVWNAGPFAQRGASLADPADEARGRELARGLGLAREDRRAFVASYCLHRAIVRTERARV